MNAEVRRILVALDLSAQSRAALESAAALAQTLDAELTGVFVHDLELVELAQLPFAREVGLTSAGRRMLDSGSMELALRARAAQARRALEAVARRLGLRWSFQVSRGHVVTELLAAAAAAEADVLAVGLCGHMEMAGRRLGSTVRGVVAEARCSVLIEQRRGHTGSALLLLYESSPSGDRALARAQHLAASRRCELVVVLTGTPEQLVSLRQQLTRTLRSDLNVHIETLEDDGKSLRAIAARHDCGLVLIPHDSSVLGREPELLGELGYPVLLAR